MVEENTFPYQPIIYIYLKTLEIIKRNKNVLPLLDSSSFHTRSENILGVIELFCFFYLTSKQGKKLATQSNREVAEQRNFFRTALTNGKETIGKASFSISSLETPKRDLQNVLSCIMNLNDSEIVNNASKSSVFSCWYYPSFSQEFGETTFPWVVFGITVFSSPVIVLLNVLEIAAVLTRKQLQRASTLLLCSMAVVDVLVGCGC